MKVLLIIVMAFVLTGCEFRFSTDSNPSITYCEMWRIWHESNGEYGWPDPLNTYEKEC